MTTTSAAIASKPARSSSSLLRHTETKTTSDDVGTRNNDIDMTTTSAAIASKPARSSSSFQRHNDVNVTSVSADSNDITVPPPVPQTSPAIGRSENSADRVSDVAKNNEYQAEKGSDVRRSDVESPGLQMKTTDEDKRVSNHKSHCTTGPTAADLGIDTPGKFLDPAKVFYPSFDLQVSALNIRCCIIYKNCQLLQ